MPRGPATEPPRLTAAAPSAPHVVVVGSGPAGLYCAFDLLASGLRVTVLDRGGDVRARRIPLARIHRGLGVDPDSNYCFGEGGAGPTRTASCTPARAIRTPCAVCSSCWWPTAPTRASSAVGDRMWARTNFQR
ncbi:MAG: FAD-binding protein [Acidobacteria bacterium]|nr:MAG: FAD-binding protein [Acidobacteriota bacterium]